jgi:hypothetical protein
MFIAATAVAPYGVAPVYGFAMSNGAFFAIAVIVMVVGVLFSILTGGSSSGGGGGGCGGGCS